jgi:hypothetical protein
MDETLPGVDWSITQKSPGAQRSAGLPLLYDFLRRCMMKGYLPQQQMNYRVKYWRWINEQAGEWYRTGLMTQESAEKVAESFRQSHEQVEVYFDDDGKGNHLQRQ